MNIGERGLLLVGCGKMGSALLRGWLNAGLSPDQVTVLDPHPSDWLTGLVSQGLKLNTPPTEPPSVAVIATKPQIMSQAIPGLGSFGNGPTLFISIAAGTMISTFEALLGNQTPVVRTMPNTPAAVGAGITALVANADTSSEQLKLAEQLMQSVGETVILDDEEQMHAVTAISGSGPAYVFAMTEALAKAGTSLGLPEQVAQTLAATMVTGSGLLMQASPDTPAQLREQVTSPKGTTAAGLERLQAEEGGLDDLMQETAQAAHDRSIALSQEAG
jgi:pyrroline-5-carboxylate reductase